MEFIKLEMQGRLVKDAEIKSTSSGKFVCTVPVAVNSGYGKNKRVCYVNMRVWGERANFVAKYFHKGDMIVAFGDLTQNVWTGNDGKTRRDYILEANEVGFGENKNRGVEGDIIVPDENDFEELSADVELPF